MQRGAYVLCNIFKPYEVGMKTHSRQLARVLIDEQAKTQTARSRRGTGPSPPTPDRTKSLEDRSSHDRLETDSRSIRSFALLF
jgi:hypothetical protein